MWIKRRRGALLGLACAVACVASMAGCAEGTVHSAVMGADQAQLVTEQCARPNPPRYDSLWQPGSQDVKQLEQDLPALQLLAPAGSAARVGDAAAYERQYFGLVVHGQRLIYVNGFQSAMANKDWKHYAIVVCDGGAWGALYDPAGHSFSALTFNKDPG